MIAQKLRYILTTSLTSTADAASLIGVSEAKMARVLKGSSELSAAELIWLSKSIGFSLDQMAR